ncbi:MAG TPA: FecR domain-containing protein, partial [Puia sp.]
YLTEVVASLKGNAEHVEKAFPAEELASSGWAHLAEKMGNADKEKMGNADKKNGRIRWMSRWRVGVAAVVLFVLVTSGMAGYFRWNRRPAIAGSKSSEVGYGGKTMLVLADGTKVWLNAGSRLVYPDSFIGKTREVELEGEAFFDVAQRAHQPFFVHTGKITVRVLGTTFDVKAYRDDAQVSATLISGKIQVIFNEDPEKKILLSPYEKLTVANVNKENEHTENELRYQVLSLPQTAEPEVVPETAWVEDRLIFNNERFEEVVRQMERRYAVHIEFENEGLRRQHVSGVFEKENLQQALDLLKMTTKFNYKIDSNEVKLIVDQN